MSNYTTDIGKRYTHFSRKKIAIGLERGESIRSIAKKLCRSPSSISREIRRNAPLFRSMMAGHRKKSQA